MKKTHALLLLILLLAFILRMYRVTDIPKGFFTDEADIGYNAWKLITTGKDEHGKSWPIFFQAYGDYRTPIPIYSNIPAILLFGLSELSVRFTTVLFGIGTVFIVYGVGKELGKSRTGLLAAFSLGISPWFIHMTRWGSEYASFPFFVAFGLWLFLRARERPRNLVFSYIVFGLGMYTYYPAWVVIPLFVFGSSVFWLIRMRWKSITYFIFAVFSFSIMLIPLVNGMRDGYALTRWNTITKVNQTPLEQLQKTMRFYRDHFSLQFLFESGDYGYPGHFITRHSVQNLGELYWFDLLSLILGILSMIIGWKKNHDWFLILFLLFLYPLGSSLSLDGPMATRSIIGVLPFSLIGALGITQIVFLLKRWKIVSVIASFVILAGVVYYLHNYLYEYFIRYPKYSSDFWGWQYGPRDIISHFIKKEANYDELVMAAEANAPQIFLPFYTLDTELGCKKCKLGSIHDLDRSKKQLFAAPPHLLIQWGNPHYIIKGELNYPDGKVAYQFVEFSD